MANNVQFQDTDLATAPKTLLVETLDVAGAQRQVVSAVQNGAWTVTASISGTVAATQSGAWTVAATQSGTWNIGTVTTVTAVTAITNTVTTQQLASATGTESNVAATGADQTILAANGSRKGGSVFNDSTAVLYLLLANATASSTVYTTQMRPNDYYEVPFYYTGVLKGIYASTAGSARVTEFT